MQRLVFATNARKNWNYFKFSINSWNPSQVCSKEMLHSKHSRVWGFQMFKEVDTAKQLILKMIADGLPPGIADFKLVISGYAKAGEIGQAIEMVKLMENRGFEPDLCTFADLIEGYSNGIKEARTIMEEAGKKEVTPEIYHNLRLLHSKLGLEHFDEVRRLLRYFV